MILGTHNSLTYAPTSTWYGRLLNFTAKCQDLPIEEQVEYGVRYFDLRIKNTSRWCNVAHGIVEYEKCIDDALSELSYIQSKLNEPIYVALNCESNDPEWFKVKYNYYKELYHTLIFTGGYCKTSLFGWEKVIDDTVDVTIHEKYWTFNQYKYSENKLKTLITNILHFSPKYWAKKNNKTYKSLEIPDTDVLVLDFVEL